MFSPGNVADELQGYVGGSRLFGELVPADRFACCFSVSYQVVNEIDRITAGIATPSCINSPLSFHSTFDRRPSS